MRVRDLMTTDVITIGPEASLKEAARRMVEAGISGMPVTGESGQLLGIITEADFLPTESERSGTSRAARLLRLFTGDAEPFSKELSVEDVMTRDVVTVSPDADHSEAARLMERSWVKRLPVVDEGGLRGLISRADILRVFSRADHEIIEEITEEVIVGTMSIDPGRIEVWCEDGNVRLSGRLVNRSDALLLVELARRVDGVVSVTDEIGWEVDNTRPSRVSQPLAVFPPKF
jgi:CBS domain-containing protein